MRAATRIKKQEKKKDAIILENAHKLCLREQAKVSARRELTTQV
jgi:hypothetical protein